MIFSLMQCKSDRTRGAVRYVLCSSLCFQALKLFIVMFHQSSGAHKMVFGQPRYHFKRKGRSAYHQNVLYIKDKWVMFEGGLLLSGNLCCSSRKICSQHTDVADCEWQVRLMGHWLQILLCASFRNEVYIEMRYAEAWLFCSDGCSSI